MILSGSVSQAVANTLGDILDEPVLPLSYRRFPDGELIVEVDRSASLPVGATIDDGGFTLDDRAVIVCSTPTPRAHLELLQLQDLATSAGAERIETVIPYLGYARQEVAHEPGQPASARAIARAIGANTDHVVTVDPHEPVVAEYFPAECTITSAISPLADALSVQSDAPVFIAPDEGARSLAIELRAAYGAGEVDHFVKERLSGETVEITPSEIDVTDREVILVDDIIATGSTMADSARLLLDRGATTVRVACVHPLLVTSGYTRLRRNGVAEIVATDTLERTVSQVSAAGPIASALSS